MFGLLNASATAEGEILWLLGIIGAGYLSCLFTFLSLKHIFNRLEWSRKLKAYYKLKSQFKKFI
jgi:hypothetical protein